MIYKLDFASGRSYIGQTCQLLGERLAQHRRDMHIKGKSFTVHRAWLKYGEPIISIVDSADDPIALNDAERKAIRKFNTLSPRGYNLSVGGDVPLCSEETRARLSTARRGVPKTLEHREKMSAAQKGRVFSAETKAKMGSAQKSRDPSTRKYLGPIMKGRKQTPEHIAKRVAAYRLAVAKRNSSEGA